MTDIQEKRVHKRIHVKFTVSCEVYNSPKVLMIVGGKSLYALMIDLNEEGMAIETKYNLPVKSVLFIKFTLINHFIDDDNNRFRTMDMVGEVRNSIPFEAKEYRIGISFTQIAEKDRKAISEFVRSTIKPREPY